MDTKSLLFLLGLSSFAHAALEFKLLEQASPDSGDCPNTITSDGKLLAGSSGSFAAVWNAQGEVTTKGTGTILGVNAEGTVFVGQTEDYHSAIWKNGLNSVPILETEVDGISYSATANGLFSVGYSENYAVRFDHLLKTKTPISFPTNFTSTAFKVTPDGNTMVGEWSWQYLHSKAFIKSGNDEFEDLGSLDGPGNYDYSAAFDISDDGKIVVGISRDQLFKWKRDTGMVGLSPSKLSGTGLRPVSISGDGKIIVGCSYANDEVLTGGFVWDESHGVRDLKSVIESGGIDLSGWFF